MNTTSTVQLLDRMDEPVIVNVSGALAFLLQCAHPLVAAGVASTKKFQKHPRLRLSHTSGTISKLMASDDARAKRIADHLARVHEQTRGELAEDVGTWKTGTSYSAADPQLLLWVYTTLVVSRVQVFSKLIQPLTVLEQEEFYQSTFAFGRHFGITEGVRPSSYAELLSYYEAVLERLAVGKDGQELAQAFMSGIGTGSGVVRVVVTELLATHVRQAYGYTWSSRHQLQARLYRPLLVKVLPLFQRTIRLRHLLPWSLRNQSTSPA